jgi:RHS repeat-associated protein
MSSLFRRAAVAGGFILLAAAAGASDHGRTRGAFQVSSGSATYTIPIWTPPGPNGLQPTIALTYNSQEGNGLAGVGWNIAGLSSISRCARTIHQDTNPSAIDYTVNDRFCINGNRLRLASGTYGVSGSVYYTELADYSRITALTSPAGTLYFLVEAKSGLKYQYGYTTDSRASISAGVHTWFLNKVYDRSNNSYIVTYTSAGQGTAIPSTIQWTPTSNGASTYRYTAFFNWKMDRLDIDAYQGSSGGYALINKGLLKGIQILSAGTTVRNYVLDHAQSGVTSRSLLTSVKECADEAAANCLSPLTFTYQPGMAGLTAGVGAAPSGSSNVLQKGRYDLNGDGKQDLVYKSGATWWVAFGGTNGFSGPYDTGVTPAGISIGRFLPTGRDAIAAKVGTNLWVYRWDDTAFAFVGYNTGISLGTMGIGTPVDQNGDGLADIVNVHSANTYLQIRLNTSSGSGNPSFASTLITTGTLPAGWRYAGVYQYSGTGLAHTDINGDGREDINVGLLWPGDFPPAEGNYAAVTVAATSIGYAVPATSQWIFNPTSDISTIDFNGDSCNDRVIGATVYIAGCHGGWSDTKILPGVPLQMLDWDGDGKTDFLVNNGGTFGVYRSTGSSFSYPILSTSIVSTGSFFAADLDGDRFDDLIKLNVGSAVSYWTHTPGGQAPSNAVNIPDLLSNVLDGFGVSNSVAYTSTSWQNYSRGATTNYPIQEAGPRIIPLGVTSTDGNGGTFEVSYSYAGLRMHATRKTAAEFQRTEEKDSRSMLITRRYFEQQFPLSRMLQQTELLRPDGVTPISRTVLTNNSTLLDTALNNQRHFTFVQASVETRFDLTSGSLLSTVTTSNQYEYTGGTLFDQTVTTDEPVSGANGNTGGGSWSKRTYFPTANITNDPSNWCLGRPGRTEVTRWHNLTYGASLTRTSTAIWDPAACRPMQYLDEPGSGTLEVVKTFGYDSFGNINSTTVTGVGMAARSTTTSYSNATYTTGQFPISTTDALGQTATTNWNFNLGVPTAATDKNGITITWYYDAFGRRVREERPDSTYSTWDYTPCSGCMAIAKTAIDRNDRISSGTTYQRSVQYLDQFDRSVSENNLRADGNYDIASRLFDSLGRVSAEYVPYTSASGLGAYVSTVYDALNRPTSISRPISETNGGIQSTNIVYNGLSEYITDPQGKQTTRIKDARGVLRSVRDHDNYSQNFEYDAFGNNKRVQDSESADLQTSTYNLRGMLTSRYDMDMGTWTFVPNALGEVVLQTDARSQTTAFQYDALGRLTQRTEAEGVSTWVWGTWIGGKNVGKLASVSGPGYVEEYLYDNLGRLSTTTIMADSVYYQIAYTYNSIGELDTLTYPTSTSSYRLKLQYDYQYGHLVGIRDFNMPVNSYWTANAFNAREQVTQAALGNGLVINRSYDAVTGLLSFIKTGLGGGSAVQNLAYEWDLVGNLKTRKDLNQANLFEEFFYDNLYRLDSSTRNGTPNLDMAYDKMGNILSKSDVGSYTYHSTSKHQLVSTSNGWLFGYDANGNMTSGRNSNIAWTSFNYPSCVTTGAACDANAAMYSKFSYTPERAYWKQESKFSGGGEAQTIYINGMLEKVSTSGGTDYKHFIRTPAATIIVSRRADGQNLTWYNLDDHLGSSAVITTSAGAVQVSLSYDAFGRRRGSTWSGAPSAGDWTSIAGTTRHGYTKHSMLDNFEFVHMNGRGYDPVVARFLSADPIYEDVLLSQSWNRYSYVQNNPLSYVDPTGFVPDGTGPDVTVCANCSTERSQVGGHGQLTGGCTSGNGVALASGGCQSAQAGSGSVIATSEASKRCVNAGALGTCILMDDRSALAYAKVLGVGGVGTIIVAAQVVPAGRAIGRATKTAYEASRAYRERNRERTRVEKISTGRTEPRDHKEQLAMEEVKANPAGHTPPRMPPMSDSKNNLQAADGWVKRVQNVNGVEIHYVENTRTGLMADFKFAD